MQESIGLVGQALCQAVRDEMTDYYRLLAVLDAQAKSAVDAEEEGDEEEPNPTSLTLRRLYVWTQDPAYRLLTLARVVEAVEGLRGGALASGACHVGGAAGAQRCLGDARVPPPPRSCATLTRHAHTALHMHISNGDPFVREFVERLLRCCLAPLIKMIRCVYASLRRKG